MAVTKLCERCDKAITFSGYIAAQWLHSDGQFICAPCRRKAAATPPARPAAGAAR